MPASGTSECKLKFLSGKYGGQEMLIEGSNKMIMGSHRNTNVYLKKKKKKKPLLFLQDLQVKQSEKRSHTSRLNCS